MISYLKGKIIVSNFGFIILDVSGVGYRITIRSDLVFKSGETVEFFIHQHLREDSSNLYGFATFDELDLFEKLISVNGVGPKAGLAIMASSETDQIIRAILSENIAFFKSISGIGSKAATKIILDLKSKIGLGKVSADVLSKTSESDDIYDALISLGYKKHELERIVGSIPIEIVGIEKKIHWCFKNLGARS